MSRAAAAHGRRAAGAGQRIRPRSTTAPVAGSPITTPTSGAARRRWTARSWGMWPTGGAWLCQHLWEHYLYTGDIEFLKKSYPILKGAAEFFLDVLVENEDGYLITSPSISPEHSHGGGTKDGLSAGRSGTSLCAGPTMDQQILRDLFANCIAASEILNLDEAFRSQVTKTRARLAPMKIGRHGQLQEWLADWDNPEDQAQPRLAPVWTVSEQPDQSAGHPGALRRRANLPESNGAIQAADGPAPGGSACGRAGRWRSCP